MVGAGLEGPPSPLLLPPLSIRNIESQQECYHCATAYTGAQAELKALRGDFTVRRCKGRNRFVEIISGVAR